MAKFCAEWHGVPKGTEVEIVDRIDDVLVVRRKDGKPLPVNYSPNGAPTAVVFRGFIDD